MTSTVLRVLTRLGIAACGTFAVAGCLDSSVGEAPPEEHAHVTPVGFVAIDPGDVAIRIGDTVRFRVTASSAGPALRIDWTTSDTAVATVDSTGLALGRGVGTVGVRALVYGATSGAAGAAALRVQ